MAKQSVSDSLKNSYRTRVTAGYQAMQSKRVVICATVRDCGDALARNIPKVDALRDCFAHSDVIIVENDSKDDTKKILAAWQERSTGVELLGEDTGQLTIPTKAVGQESPWFSSGRVTKMAGFRNQYMDFIDAMPDAPDYVIAIDLDCQTFFVDGIANSFGFEGQWDAVTANGRYFKSSESIYFDTYAVHELGCRAPQTEEQLRANQWLLAPLAVGMPLFPVKSAFGGMAIYRYPALAGKRYGCSANDDPVVVALCEHAFLFEQMAVAGASRVFINPSMVLHYNRPRGMRRALPVGSVPFT